MGAPDRPSSLNANGRWLWRQMAGQGAAFPHVVVDIAPTEELTSLGPHSCAASTVLTVRSAYNVLEWSKLEPIMAWLHGVLQTPAGTAAVLPPWDEVVKFSNRLHEFDYQSLDEGRAVAHLGAQYELLLRP